MQDLNDLFYFVQVVDHGGFAPAGWAPRREIIHAVFPTRRGLLPSVRALIDSLATQFAGMDDE